MARVKRGKVKTQKRTRLLKLAKGFKFGGKSKERAAKERLLHAFVHSYQGRKQKKRDYRRLWQVRLGAFLRERDMKYNEFINQLSKKNIILNRKVMSELANEEPEVLEGILKEIQK
ncbi:MAG: 50S ribosomal protein L20 [Patescibacteria group bacterium]